MFNRQRRGCGCGCNCNTRTARSVPPTINCEAVTYVTTPDCEVSALDMVLDTSSYCAMPCEFITYTLTITNNCSSEILNPILNVELGNNLCYIRDTLTVDGTIKEGVRCLKNLILDPIAVGATVTITFQARIMTNDRYVVTYADLGYRINCCCTTKCLHTISNGTLVQVCQCCGGATAVNREQPSA